MAICAGVIDRDRQHLIMVRNTRDICLKKPRTIITEIIMKWDRPQLVDLADRHNALNAVGFSVVDVKGSTCQNGSTHSTFCYTGASATHNGIYYPPSFTESNTIHSSTLA